jgi:ferredoxin
VPTLTIHPTGEVIYLDPDETVLSGLFKAGYAYTVGCRRGGCAICKVDCRQGRFTYNRPIAPPAGFGRPDLSACGRRLKSGR